MGLNCQEVDAMILRRASLHGLERVDLESGTDHVLCMLAGKHDLAILPARHGGYEKGYYPAVKNVAGRAGGLDSAQQKRVESKLIK